MIKIDFSNAGISEEELCAFKQKALDAAKYVVEVGSSFEAQISKVQAISGADTGDTKRLADAAAEMGRTTMFSATQAGEALILGRLQGNL